MVENLFILLSSYRLNDICMYTTAPRHLVVLLGLRILCDFHSFLPFSSFWIGRFQRVLQRDRVCHRGEKIRGELETRGIKPIRWKHALRKCNGHWIA